MTGFCQAPNRTKETGTMSVLLFIGVEMGTFLSVAEELWQEPKDLAGAFAGAQRFL